MEKSVQLSPMSKNILLIGKYPPVEGGIAAKTFWLYRQLETKGFNTQVITTEIQNYTILESPKEDNVHLVDAKKIPWHIPYTELVYEILLNESLDVVKSFNPDIIETNYLWPYCSVALSLAQSLKKPLLIRHAGSDIQKFKSDHEFNKIISHYLNQANRVVTNNTSYNFIYKLCKDKSKVVLMPRYIPDPLFFKEEDNPKKYDILFAGKINYFWQQKGIDILLSLIRKGELKALFIIDGNYRTDLLKIIERENLGKNIKIINFVHPKEMSKFINQCKSVWCWESEDAIEDFSNLIWEACFCNVKCIINSDVKNGEELDYLIKIFPGLIEMLNGNEVMDPKSKDSKYATKIREEKRFEEIHRTYIDQNIALYDSMLE
jgi:hypothetical protein